MSPEKDVIRTLEEFLKKRDDGTLVPVVVRVTWEETPDGPRRVETPVVLRPRKEQPDEPA